jgi:hypothetical protein
VADAGIFQRGEGSTVKFGFQKGWVGSTTIFDFFFKGVPHSKCIIFTQFNKLFGRKERGGGGVRAPDAPPLLDPPMDNKNDCLFQVTSAFEIESAGTTFVVVVFFQIFLLIRHMS